MNINEARDIVTRLNEEKKKTLEKSKDGFLKNMLKLDIEATDMLLKELDKYQEEHEILLEERAYLLQK